MAEYKTLNQAKGTEYEITVLEEIEPEYEQSRLWKNVPEKILIDNKIIINYNKYSESRKDIGVDIVAVKNGVFTYIQCKNYKNNILISDIAGFLFFLITNNVSGIICYSNDISSTIKNELSAKAELMTSKIGLRKIPFNNAKIINPQPRLVVDKIYRPYQNNAIRILLKNYNKCILAMPCGTGKTFTVSAIAKKYNNIIILSPLRQLTSDILDNMSVFLGDEYNKILISTDGVRDIETIRESIGNKNIIACTYCSVDVLIKIIDELDDLLIIVDEFHNLTPNHLTNHNDDMYKILNTNTKTIYMSATPNYAVEFNNLYIYDWEKAIRDKYICDFNITIPLKEIIDEDNLTKMLELLKNIADIDEKMIKKGYFLIRSLLLNGNKKCIVFLTTTKKADLFENILRGFMKLLNIEFEIFMITYKTTKNNRSDSIYRFKHNIQLSIILNVHILDEGIDIPECDSVYITQPNNNKENLIQRLCRCNRVTNTKKVCNMYIWSTANKTNKLLKYIMNNTYDNIRDKINLYNPAKNIIKKNKPEPKNNKSEPKINDTTHTQINNIDPIDNNLRNFYQFLNEFVGSNYPIENKENIIIECADLYQAYNEKGKKSNIPFDLSTLKTQLEKLNIKKKRIRIEGNMEFRYVLNQKNLKEIMRNI